MSQVIGGLTYLGVDTYWETDASGLDIDDYGLDTLTRTYNIRPDYVASFLLLFPRGTQDATYPWLYSVSRKLTNVRGPLVTAVVTFKGIQSADAGATLYHEQQRGGVAKAQVVLASADGTGQRTMDYRAPYSEWRYTTTQKPDRPRHVGEMAQTKLNFTMLSTTGSLGTIYINPRQLVPPEAPPDPSPLHTFNGLITIQNSAFEFEEVVKPKLGSSGASSIWTVLERNEARVVDYVQYAVQQLLVSLGNNAQ